MIRAIAYLFGTVCLTVSSTLWFVMHNYFLMSIHILAGVAFAVMSLISTARR